MEDLTKTELAFLARHGFSPEDVYDSRSLPVDLWKELMRADGKMIALGSRCRKAGHRLRTRANHCAQCDPKKLAFQARYHADQYVYIAGSASARLIKIGTCGHCGDREHSLRNHRYGGAADWEVIFSVKVSNAGSIEDAARSRLSRYIILRPYWKDGLQQTAIELLQCSFTEARNALMGVARRAMLAEPWKARFTSNYEFERTETDD